MANPKSPKNLRQVISKLDLWLGSLEPIAIKLQNQALKARGQKLGENTSVDLNSLSDNISNLRDYIDSQRASLGLLKRAPPGIVSSIIDFLYSIAVDSKATSQKQEHFNKLRELDKTLRRHKDQHTVGRSLRIPDDAIEEGIREQVQSTIYLWTQTGRSRQGFHAGSPEAKKLEESIISKTKDILDTMFAGYSGELGDEVAVLTQEFAKGLINESVQVDDIETFILGLKEKLHKVCPTDSRENLDKGIENVLKFTQKTSRKSTLLLPTRSAKIVYSSSPKENAILVFQEYLRQLKRYFEDVEKKTFPNQVDNLLGQLKEKAKTKEIDTAQRYHRYVDEVFGPGKHNVAYYLKNIKQSLDNLVATLSATGVPVPMPTPTTPALTEETKVVEEVIPPQPQAKPTHIPITLKRPSPDKISPK